MAGLLLLDSSGVVAPQKTMAERLTEKYNPAGAREYAGVVSGAYPIPIEESLYDLVRFVAGTHKGILREDFRACAREIEPVHGARELVEGAVRKGYVPVILSADYVHAAGAVARPLGVEKYFGNVPVFRSDRHAGKVREPIIIGGMKARIARRVIEEMRPDRIAAITDDLPDFEMLGLADPEMRIACAPRDKRLSGFAAHTVNSPEEALAYL